jgi:hypothetical protein
MSVRYITRDGRRIAVETLDTGIIPKTKRKPFKAQFVMLPLHWAETLRRSKSVSTYQLAHVILFEAFKRSTLAARSCCHLVWFRCIGILEDGQ